MDNLPFFFNPSLGCLVAWMLGCITGRTIILLWPLKTLKSSHFSAEETDDADNIDDANDTDDTYDTYR